MARQRTFEANEDQHDKDLTELDPELAWLVACCVEAGICFQQQHYS